MIERCKKGKIWYRSVCTLLSVALCVCMLSGCRSRQESASVGTKTAQTYADTENGEITTDETESQDDSDKIQTVWQTAEKAVTDEADKADDVMTQLSESVSSGDADRVIELADTLSGQLDSSYTAAEEWQTALQEVSDSLDDEARTVYEEREKAFNESVSESRDEASALLAGIKESAGIGRQRQSRRMSLQSFLALMKRMRLTARIYLIQSLYTRQKRLSTMLTRTHLKLRQLCPRMKARKPSISHLPVRQNCWIL